MSVNLTTVRDHVAAIINAVRGGFGYGTGTANPLWDQLEIEEAVKAAAYGVMMVIYDTPNHRYRALALELRALANGELLKGPIGAVLIDGEKGTLIKPSKLRRFKTNRMNLTTIAAGGYYSVEGHIVNFIGSAATAETLKALSSSDLDVPDEYEPLVTSGALFFAHQKQGANTDASANCRAFYEKGLEMIREGKTAVPAFDPFGTYA